LSNPWHKLIDFNALLRAANVIVAALIAVALWVGTSNEYVDGRVLSLGLVLCFQTHLALLFERRHRDPFIIVMAMGTIPYYAFRLVTLSVDPYSIVFDRFPYTVDDSVRGLIFILIANCFLYAGCVLARLRADRPLTAGRWRATTPGSAIALMVVTTLTAYFSGNYWTTENLPRALTVLIVFVSPVTLVLMALAYYLLFAKWLGKGFSLTIAVLIGLEILAHTLFGSRSAILGFAQNFVMVLLAIQGSIKLSRAFVTIGLLALPVIAVVLVAAFAISTFNRLTRAQALDVDEALQSASQASTDLAAGRALPTVLPALLSRAGFFDFASEIIAHRDEYRSVINLPTYQRSIIDNILTPGFDVFDQPKIANSLMFVYKQWGKPSKKVVDEAYQSDQLTIYGESYALFGYGGLPLLFLLTFLVKRVYAALSSPSPFALAMKRIFVLFVFSRTFDSFGIDWVIGEALPLAINMYFYGFLFASRPMVAAPPPPPQVSLAGGAAGQ
jgi:hypothetical protein